MLLVLVASKGAEAGGPGGLRNGSAPHRPPGPDLDLSLEHLQRHLPIPLLPLTPQPVLDLRTVIPVLSRLSPAKPSMYIGSMASPG